MDAAFAMERRLQAGRRAEGSDVPRPGILEGVLRMAQTCLGVQVLSRFLVQLATRILRCDWRFMRSNVAMTMSSVITLVPLKGLGVGFRTLNLSPPKYVVTLVILHITELKTTHEPTSNPKS